MNNSVESVGASGHEKLVNLKQLTLITYVLYALSLFTGLTAFIALIINYVKREDAQGSIYESHFTWQIRTFWWGLLWVVLGSLTAMFMVGYAIFFGAYLWCIYRIVKGFLNWNDGKPMPI